MTREQHQQAEDWLRGWTGVKGCYGQCRSQVPNSDWTCAWCSFWTLLTDLTTHSVSDSETRPASPVAPQAHHE